MVVFILNTASPWIIPKRSTAPQHIRSILPPIHSTKSIAALHGRYFLQIEPYVVVQFHEIGFRLLTEQPQSVILVLERRPGAVSALRPAFFIPNLESCISRSNVILCHNLTLSVGEPDNAAAKQGQELRSGQTATPLHEQNNLYLFFSP